MTRRSCVAARGHDSLLLSLVLIASACHPTPAVRTRQVTHDRHPAPATSVDPEPATAQLVIEASEPSVRTPTDLPGRRSPSLFRGREGDADRSARERVLRAFRARSADWLECYAAVSCRGEAEPARVEVRFEVRADGSVSGARIIAVTERCEDPRTGDVVDVEGDVDGPLARCLVAAASRVVAEPGANAFESGFVFLPDSTGCERRRERGAPGPCDP